MNATHSIGNRLARAASPRAPRASGGFSARRIAPRLLLTATALLAALSLAPGVVASADATEPNPVVLENQNPGTTAWQIGQGSNRVAEDPSGQIKGYASATSVNLGQSITFNVSVNPAQSYTIDIYRLGCYPDANGNCLGGRFMTHLGPFEGIQQPACSVDGPTGTNTGLTVCNWSGPSFTVPGGWTSGVYLAVLTNAAGYQNYIPFTVRDDARKAALLYVEPVATYEAYNNWPDYGSGSPSNGKSLYDSNSGGGETVAGPGRTRAVQVSFDRPYSDTGANDLTDPNGWSWEEYFIQWAEKAGYDITYATSTDLDQNPSMALNYKGVISVGHDEYWSKAMFDGAEAAREAGINLGFFGGNDVYWQVRFQPSAGGAPDRIMVGYKNSPNNTYSTNDPVTPPSLETVRFQDPPVNRPGQMLTGESFLDTTERSTLNTNLIVSDEQAWPFAGSGLTGASSVYGIVGYETDAYSCHYPLPANSYYTILSSSPFTGSDGYTSYAQSSLYKAASGAWVFDAGTMSWNWALGRSGWVDSRIQQVSANLMDALSGKSTPVAGSTHIPPCSVQRNANFEEARLTGPPIPSTPSGADKALGTVSLESVNPIDGSYSAHVPNTGSSYLDELLTPTDDTTVTFSMRLNALPAGSARVGMLSSMINTEGNLWVLSNGQLCLKNGAYWVGGTTSTACTSPLSVGTAYRVMLREIRGNGSDAILEAWVAPLGQAFGAPFTQMANGAWTTRADKLDFGATTSIAVDAVFDDVEVNGHPFQAPSVPAGLGASATSSTSVALSWQDTPDETGYVLERDTSVSFPSPTRFSPAANTVAYTDSSVSQGTTYYYRLHTVGEGGSSASTAAVAVTTPITPPAAPSNLQATYPSATQTQLTWTNNATNESSIVLERSGTKSFSSPVLITLAPGTSSYLDTVPVEGPYYYRVKAVNAGGSSAYTAVVGNSRIKDITFEDGTTNLINVNTGVEKNPNNLVAQETLAPVKGLYSARVPNASGAWVEQDFANASNLYISLYLRVNAIPSSDMRVLQVMNGTSTYIANLWVRSSGLLCLKNGAYWNGGNTTTACTASALVPGATYRIGLHELAGNGTSSAVLEGFYARNTAISGDNTGTLTQFSTWTLTPTTGGYFTLPGNGVRFGATLNSPLDATFDDVKLDTAFMPGASS